MQVEIERKFLVESTDFKTEAFREIKIFQGYLNSHPERSVRIRIKDKTGVLTIKGKSEDGGVSRLEWEREIPLDEAETLLKLCEPGIIEKTRFLIKMQGGKSNQLFEVDEFHGENEGLIIAEVELSSPDAPVIFPDWLGKEVTGEKKYYNSQLSKKPFKKWEEFKNS